MYGKPRFLADGRLSSPPAGNDTADTVCLGSIRSSSSGLLGTASHSKSTKSWLPRSGSRPVGALGSGPGPSPSPTPHCAFPTQCSVALRTSWLLAPATNAPHAPLGGTPQLAEAMERIRLLYEK